jgi:hypothetical protein
MLIRLSVLIDMILGRDLMSQLRIILNFDGQTDVGQVHYQNGRVQRSFGQIILQYKNAIGMKNCMKVKHSMMYPHVLRKY